MNRIIVVGGGQAGAALVARLRAAGYSKELILIGRERFLPYQRPPLSKAYLLGEMTLDRLYLRPKSFYDDQDIKLRLGHEVKAVNVIEKTISLAGETLSYDQLAFTTGSAPRRFPAAMGGDLDGVHTIRGLADVDSMVPEFTAGRRALIVGGGYIGLEAAAVAAKRALDVTLIEAGDRILQRVAAPQTADHIRALHKTHGVKIMEGLGLKHLTGQGRVTGAVLSDGREIPADFVIVGVGISPCSSLAAEAGLRIENGIWTNSFGQTSDAAVWAAGDCASFPFEGKQYRLESVGHAIDHAECVAGNMLGGSTVYNPRPWFWSDQYDVKLQIAGLSNGYNQVVIREGDAGSRSVWYYNRARLLAVDAINDPRAYMVGKRIIDVGHTVAAEVVENRQIDVKEILKAAGPVGAPRSDPQ